MNIPAEAHIRFLCPFCQHAGIESRCTTADAADIVVLPDGRVSFRRIPCFHCKKRLTLDAKPVVPQVLDVSPSTP